MRGFGPKRSGRDPRRRSYPPSVSFALLPQALPDLIGTTVYVLDDNGRSAAILGLVGAGGIGYDMVMAMRLYEFDRLGLIAVAVYRPIGRPVGRPQRIHAIAGL